MTIPTGKCPSCGKLLSEIHFEEVSAAPGFFSQGAWRSLAYLCPHCRAVLSVQIDPIAVRSEVFEHVDQAVGPLAQEVATLRNHVATLDHRISQLLQSRN